jgi:hypothetical protein
MSNDALYKAINKLAWLIIFSWFTNVFMLFVILAKVSS